MVAVPESVLSSARFLAESPRLSREVGIVSMAALTGRETDAEPLRAWPEVTLLIQFLAESYFPRLRHAEGWMAHRVTPVTGLPQYLNMLTTY